MIGATYTLRLQADENEAKIRKDTQAAQILENLHSANRALEREQARANELERRRTLEVQRTSEISALIAAEIDAGTSIANNIQGAADRNSPDVADDRFEIVFTPLVEKWRERVEVMLDRELPGLISGPSSRQFVVLGRQEQPGDSCDSLGVSRTCAESNGPCPYMYRESLGSVAHRRA